MGIQLGSAYGKIELDASGVRSGVQQAQGALSGLRGAMQNVFSTAGGFLAANIFMKIGDTIRDAFSTGAKVTMDYQDSLNLFEATAEATGEQMTRVGEMAKTLGADMSLPATSAGDAAAAMTELVKAGLSVDETLAAAKGTLQLAAAGQLSEAAAAEIAANAINAWRNAEGEAALKGTDATRVADLLAAAANSSSGEVTDMADSLKMAAAVFAAAGIPIEDTVAVIGEMANAGIQGSDAGTSLKQMLLSLQAPSDTAKKQMDQLGISIYDAQGKMLPIKDVIANMNQALFGTSEAMVVVGGRTKEQEADLKRYQKQLASMENSIQDYSAGIKGAGLTEKARSKKLSELYYESGILRGEIANLNGVQGTATKVTKQLTQEQRNEALATIFGSDAVRAANVVLGGGVEAFDKMKTAVTREGAASELAGARMKGLRGALEGMKSQFETALLTFAEPLLGPLEEAVRGVADKIGGADVMAALQGAGADLGGALARGLTGAANFAKTLPTMIGRAVGLVAPILGTLRDTIVGVLSSPEMEAAGSMVGAGLKVFADWATTAWPIVSVTIQEVIRRIGELIQGSLLPTFTEVVAKVGAFFSTNGPLINQFLVTVGGAIANLVTLIQGAWPIVSALIGGVVDVVLGLGKAIMQMVTGDWSGAWETIKSTVSGAWEAVKTAFGALITWITGWFGTSWAGIVKLWQGNWDMLRAIVELTWNTIQTWIAVTLMNIGLKVEGELGKIRNKFDEVMNSIKEKVEGIKGTLDRFVKFIQEKVTGPLLWFVSNVLKPIQKGFEGIIGAAQFLQGVIGELIDALKKVKIPANILGHSPSPFENSLRGISAAMGELASVRVPDVIGSLGALGGATPALASTGSATGYYDYRNYSSPVNLTAQVGSELDLEVIAYRVASMIRSMQG
jgi:TP901 family phage tail tape measure protein